jgi:hypothetical protein
MDQRLRSVDDVRRQPLEIWNGVTAWVWGLTFGQFLALQREAQFPGPEGEPHFDPERYALCRVIECVRDSGEPGAAPLFTRRDDYEWLRARSAQSVERILRLSMALSGELGTEGPDGPDPPLAEATVDLPASCAGSA